ncbi:MAG: dihydrofolate reductase [Sphingomonadaceae bacterium]
MTRPEIVLVVAAAENGVIGRNGAMPWHLPEDLRRFKRMTVGHAVLMGRKTFEAIGRPLPGRHNIVLTRDSSWKAEGVTAAANLAEAIAAAGLDPRTRADPFFVIGGGAIYALCQPIATRVELTRVHQTPAGDTHFPPLDAREWSLVVSEPGEGVTYETWVRPLSPDGSTG